MNGDELQQVIVCAACKHGDVIICGPRHYDPVMISQLKAFPEDSEVRMMKRGDVIQGFVDQWGTFLDRYQALEVAKQAGQINTRRQKTDPTDCLFSEDLY